jgi:ABC-2 type transport system permease protein
MRSGRTKMRKAFRIAQREYRATVKTKGFIIGLVLAPVVMGGSGIAMALLEDRVDHEDKMIAVVDRSGLLAESLVRAAAVRTERDVYDAESGEQLRAAYGIQVVQPARDYDVQLLGLSDRVQSGDLHAIVEISEGVLHPRRDGAAARIGYYAQNPAMDDVRNWVGRQLNDELRRLRLDHAGVDQSALPDLFDWIQPEPLRPVSIDPETGAIGDAERSSELEALLIPIIPTVLMFLMLMMGAVPQLQAVTEEKAQRIAEVMLGSVRPFEFMLGKLMGGVGVSLTAATVYVVGGVAAIRFMELGQYIPYHVLPWFFVYVVAAVFMVGALQAALGSACNDASEAQSVAFVAMLPLMIPMFVLVPIAVQPESGFATGMSLFPLFTPFLMLLRQAGPAGVAPWQPWVGLVGMAAFTALLVWVGGRIFRVGIMMQGTPPRLGNILRWAIRG